MIDYVKSVVIYYRGNRLYYKKNLVAVNRDKIKAYLPAATRSLRPFPALNLGTILS